MSSPSATDEPQQREEVRWGGEIPVRVVLLIWIMRFCDDFVEPFLIILSVTEVPETRGRPRRERSGKLDSVTFGSRRAQMARMVRARQIAAPTPP